MLPSLEISTDASISFHQLDIGHSFVFVLGHVGWGFASIDLENIKIPTPCFCILELFKEDTFVGRMSMFLMFMRFYDSFLMANKRNVVCQEYDAGGNHKSIQRCLQRKNIFTIIRLLINQVLLAHVHASWLMAQF